MTASVLERILRERFQAIGLTTPSAPAAGSPH